MPLTLVLGPANSAKAGEVLGAYTAAAPRGALLVVPTAADVEHYRGELANEGAVLGTVLTFSGLTREIVRRTGLVSRRLTALQRDRLLRRAIRGARLDVLRSSAESPGFLSAAGDLLGELERSLVTPQRFWRALEAWAAEDQRRGPFARELGSIYLAYASELERVGCLDPDLYAWRALDALRAAPAAWGADPVFFYGFDDLHPLQRDAVETLARVVGASVTVSLTYEAGRAALGARAEVVAELRQIAQRVLELPPLDEYYESESRAALHHLERELFEAPGEQVDPRAAIRLLEAGGERAEAELVAAEVLALLRAGVPAEEIVVVYRSLGRAAPVIERAFARYGIHPAIERQVSFGHTSLGRGLLALARCALLEDERTRPEDLLWYLRTPGMLERPELADALEARVRRECLRTAAQAREVLGWDLREIEALRDARDKAAALADQARRLFAAPHRARAPLLGVAEELDARALAAVLGAVAEVGELGETLSGEEVIELLEGLVVSAGGVVPAGAAPGAGRVLLAEPLAIRARRFRAVFVCGLQEGEFPLAPAPEPFLSDERRRELAACSGLRLRAVEDALARERYLFYACLSRATEQVILSYRSSDEEGNLALPSPFIADVSELLVPGWRERRRRRLLADVVWDEEEAPTVQQLTLARTAAEGASTNGLGMGVGGPASLEARTLSERAMRDVRHRHILSARALESYADCPMKWLVESELQPSGLEPDPDPLARGSYMHTVLEQVLRRLGGPLTPQSLPDALGLLEEVLGELDPPVPPGRPGFLRAIASRSVEADLRRYLEHEAATGCGWRPGELELRFGFEDEDRSLGPAGIGEGAERILLRGMIDRLDVDPAGGGRAIVWDYKSGRSAPKHRGSRWASDRSLQVALYMLAVRDLLGLEPIGGLYQPLAGESLCARGIFLKDSPPAGGLAERDGREPEELQAELEHAARTATSLAARLRSGEVLPCPQTCSADGCRHPGICRSR